MKYLVTICCLAFLISCNHDETIEGSWINVSAFIGNEEPSIAIPQSIYEFNNGKLRVIELGNHTSGNLLEITEVAYNYFLEKDLVKIDWGSGIDTLEYHLNDSLVLSF